MHCFSFDIETIPDVELGRRLWGLDDLSDADVGTAMGFLRQQKTGSDFMPLHMHRVVAISVASKRRPPRRHSPPFCLRPLTCKHPKPHSKPQRLTYGQQIRTAGRIERPAACGGAGEGGGGVLEQQLRV